MTRRRSPHEIAIYDKQKFAVLLLLALLAIALVVAQTVLI